MEVGHSRTAARRRQERALRRKAILDAAREIFFTKGFMAATMESIA